MAVSKRLSGWIKPQENPLYTQFSRKRLIQLLIPLIIEQVIIVAVAFIDAMMLSSISEDAYAAISLVDMINLLLMQVFVAIGAGGSIIAAQYIGKRDRESAITTANQTALMLMIFSSLVALAALIANQSLLRAIYPKVGGNTMAYATQFLALSAISYPAYALYYCGSSLLYAQSNSRSSMLASFIMNAVKVLLNLLFIRVFHLGVLGIGFATLVSRLTGAFIVTHILLDKRSMIHYRRPFTLKLVFSIDRRIFKVAGPSGAENFLFNLGKLAIGTIFAGFSSAMIAANAASNTLSSIINMPGNAINLATVTIISQCAGAKLFDEAQFNAKRMLWLHYAAQAVMGLILFVFVQNFVDILGLSKEAGDMTVVIIRIYAVLSFVIEPLAFGLPNTLRAAGDNKSVMYSSILSMLLFRVGFSYLLVYVFHLQLHGLWSAMYIDWIVRSVFFVLRFKSGKWKQHSLV